VRPRDPDAAGNCSKAELRTIVRDALTDARFEMMWTVVTGSRDADCVSVDRLAAVMNGEAYVADGTTYTCSR